MLIEAGRRINTMDLNIRVGKVFSNETGALLGEVCGLAMNYENFLFDTFDIPPCEFRRLGIKTAENYAIIDQDGKEYHRILVMEENENNLAEHFAAAYTGDDFNIDDARAELRCACTENGNRYEFIDGSVLELTADGEYVRADSV